MNYLELVKRAWTESSQSGGGPVSVVGMSGHQQKFVDWVRDAWVDIQQYSDEWVFLKNSAVCTLTSGQESVLSAILGIADLKKPLVVFIMVDGQWQQLPLSISLSSSGEWSQVNKQSGRPTKVYFSNGSFSFDSIPDANYQLKIHYVKSPQELMTNADTPWCDASYHRTIMWHAVKTYAADDGDQALYNRANMAYEAALMAMLSDLTPRFTFGASAFR